MIGLTEGRNLGAIALRKPSISDRFLLIVLDAYGHRRLSAYPMFDIEAP